MKKSFGDFELLMWIFCVGLCVVVFSLIIGKPDYATPPSIISAAALIAAFYEKWKQNEKKP